MKKLLLLLMIISLLCQCEKEDNDILFQDVTLSKYGTISVNEGDTTSILKGQLLRYRVYLDSPTEITWNFGDGYTEKGTMANHAYLENGIFEVTITNDKNTFRFFVNVHGILIQQNEEGYKGVFLFSKTSSEKYIITNKEKNDEFYIHKLIDGSEASSLHIDNITSGNLLKFKIDSDNNFIILFGGSFSKVDLSATSLYCKPFQNWSTIGWDFYEDTNGDYYFSGINSGDILLEKRNKSGELLESFNLSDFEDEVFKSCKFINENNQLLLQVKNDASTNSYSGKLILKNILNNEVTKLILPEYDYSNIAVTESGALIFGFEFDKNTLGGPVYLNISKITFDLDVEWTHRIQVDISDNYQIEFYDDFIDINNENYTQITETSDAYYLFYSNKIIIISKSDFSLQIKELSDPNFTINAVSKIDNNKLEILGTIDNSVYSNTDGIGKYTILLCIDELGELIE